MFEHEYYLQNIHRKHVTHNLICFVYCETIYFKTTLLKHCPYSLANTQKSLKLQDTLNLLNKVRFATHIADHLMKTINALKFLETVHAIFRNGKQICITQLV